MHILMSNIKQQFNRSAMSAL